MAGQNPIVKIFSCSQSIDLASKIAKNILKDQRAHNSEKYLVPIKDIIKLI